MVRACRQQPRSSEEWAIHLLEQQGVLVQPGYFYDLSGASLRPDASVVLSLLCERGPFAIDLWSGASGLGWAPSRGWERWPPE